MTRLSVLEIAQQSRKAAQTLAFSSAAQRNQALVNMIDALHAAKQNILTVNQEEVELARASGQSSAILKRLTIDESVLSYMVSRLTKLHQLPDPLGKTLHGHRNANGLNVYKKTVSLGVIAIIYESRPNVTTDAAAVCLKSGNAVILRGGSEAIKTNALLTQAMTEASLSAGLPESCIQMIKQPGHQAVSDLLSMHDYIDVLIPRGGKSLIQRISSESTIPVIKHYDGICHLYIAEDAAFETAIGLTVNSKCQSVQVCNALETLLIDRKCASKILPRLASTLMDEGIELRGCPKSCSIVPGCVSATEEDWATEYLAPILSIKIVNDIHAAISHINDYGSGHTDAIVTQSLESATIFEQQVDSASVLINASTRLSGGGDYGLGSVVGISTDKLHARGPVGIEELTTYKWVAYGNGHLRN